MRTYSVKIEQHRGRDYFIVVHKSGKLVGRFKNRAQAFKVRDRFTAWSKQGWPFVASDENKG